MSVNTSFGSEPPRLGRMCGFMPAVFSSDFAANFAHGLSGSRRVAFMITSRACST